MSGQPASPLPGAQQPFTLVQGLFHKAAQQRGYQGAQELPHSLCRAPAPAFWRQPKLQRAPTGGACTLGIAIEVSGPGVPSRTPRGIAAQVVPTPHIIFLSLFVLKGLLHPCLRILLEDEIQY